MATLTATGVAFGSPQNAQYANYNQNTSAKAFFTTAGGGTASANTSYQNGTGNIMVVNYAFYHPWQQSYDDAYIQISPNNSTWYLVSRQSNTRAGQSYFNTVSAMVPPGWYYRGIHSYNAVQRVHYQY